VISGNTCGSLPALLYGRIVVRPLKMFRVGIKFPYHGLPRVCMIFVKDHIVITVLNMNILYDGVSVVVCASYFLG